AGELLLEDRGRERRRHMPGIGGSVMPGIVGTAAALDTHRIDSIGAEAERPQKARAGDPRGDLASGRTPLDHHRVARPPTEKLRRRAGKRWVRLDVRTAHELLGCKPAVARTGVQIEPGHMLDPRFDVLAQPD